MRKLLVVAISLSFLLPALAEAQTNSPPNVPRLNRPAGPAKTPAHRARPPAHRPANPAAGRPQRPGKPPFAGKPSRPRPPTAGRPNRHPSAGRPHRPPQAGRPHRPPQAGRPHRPHYARPLPPRGNQFWHRGQYYGRIRGPAYSYPRGYSYRRWSIGAFLPPLLLGSTYRYDNYAALGLEAPPPGYAWVRYGPDLLLVNLTTRETEDVVYGVFQ